MTTMYSPNLLSSKINHFIKFPHLLQEKYPKFPKFFGTFLRTTKKNNYREDVYRNFCAMRRYIYQIMPKGPQTLIEFSPDLHYVNV
jgi:hypothetical protein